MAVSGDGRSWYLLNAAPDLRAQLVAMPELAPGPGPTLGLLALREAEHLTATAIAVGTKRSRYAVGATIDGDWVVAYRRRKPAAVLEVSGGSGTP